MAATDVLTVQRAKDVLGTAVGDPRRHLLLASMVTGVSEVLDRLVGPIVRRTITNETHQRVCGTSLRLHQTPVSSVSTLVEWKNGVSTALTAESVSTAGDYRLEPSRRDPALSSGLVTRRSSWRDYWWLDVDVVATYVAGRYATTEAAQDTRFGEAAAKLLASEWASEWMGVGQVGEYDVPQSSYPRRVPNLVYDLLRDDIAIPVA